MSGVPSFLEVSICSPIPIPKGPAGSTVGPTEKLCGFERRLSRQPVEVAVRALLWPNIACAEIRAAIACWGMAASPQGRISQLAQPLVRTHRCLNLRFINVEVGVNVLHVIVLF